MPRWGMSESPAKITGEVQFATRIDAIRARFAVKLADKIQQTDAAIAHMAGDPSHVSTAYRWFHDVSGIGPTLGFQATGLAARACADILLGPFRARRGLSPEELASLTTGLEAVRIAALRESHSTEPDRK